MQKNMPLHTEPGFSYVKSWTVPGVSTNTHLINKYLSISI